jgi:hypothetical protein
MRRPGGEPGAEHPTRSALRPARRERSP